MRNWFRRLWRPQQPAGPIQLPLTPSAHNDILKDMGPSISEILKVSGAAGASVGILDGRTGQTYAANYGLRDVALHLPPDEHTVYHIASLSKAFTATAIALLVGDGKISFGDRLHELLPGYLQASEEVFNNATVLDYLSHRTGLATKNALWQQDGPELLLEGKDTLPVLSYLESLEPLGQSWIYNNWGYDMLASLIYEVSGLSWGDFVESRILQPLGLQDTTTHVRPQTDNWAQGYMPAPNGDLTDIGHPVVAAGTSMQAAAGIKSSVHDLILFYNALMNAWRSETNTLSGEDGHSLPPGPLTNIKELFTPHIPLDAARDPDLGRQWYGAGFVLTELPTPMGRIGFNGEFLPSMPIVGRGCEGKKVWYHNGMLVGFLSSVHILPENGTIIVVLVNSLSKNDSPDWIGQMLIEGVLSCPEKNDYVGIARETAATYDAKWRKLPDEVRKLKSPGKNSQPLSEYTGRYFNKVGNWFISVSLDDDGLLFSFQGRASQTHRLQVHGNDRFSWLVTEESNRHRARWPWIEAVTYIFDFGKGDGGSISTLRWVHDFGLPEGEVFTKRTENADDKLGSTDTMCRVEEL